MEFKYIKQPDFAYRFRGSHHDHRQTFDIDGFTSECVFAKVDGKPVMLDRQSCDIDQWTGFLDQNHEMVFTNDIVELRNSSGKRVGLFLVRYHNLQGRFILEGLTRGANVSRLTTHQDIRVVSNIYDKNLNIKEYEND